MCPAAPSRRPWPTAARRRGSVGRRRTAARRGWYAAEVARHVDVVRSDVAGDGGVVVDRRSRILSTISGGVEAGIGGRMGARVVVDVQAAPSRWSAMAALAASDSRSPDSGLVELGRASAAMSPRSSRVGW